MELITRVPSRNYTTDHILIWGFLGLKCRRGTGYGDPSLPRRLQSEICRCSLLCCVLSRTRRIGEGKKSSSPYIETVGWLLLPIGRRAIEPCVMIDTVKFSWIDFAPYTFPNFCLVLSQQFPITKTFSLFLLYRDTWLISRHVIGGRFLLKVLIYLKEN